jgi:hypothetical protein
VSNPGIYEGETCNRIACHGVIDSHEAVNCSCHICAPCSACTAPRNFCPKCGWEESDDRPINGYIVNVDPATGNYRTWTKRKLDPSKIDYRIESHTYSSQICEGVYPPGTTSKEVLEKVRGTFGGRFEYFGNGKFKYIAYTD